MRCPAPRSLGATLLFAIHLLGCTEWHVEQATPQATLDAKHPTSVRVTLRDTTRMVLTHSTNPSATPYGQVSGRPSGFAVGEIVLANPSIIGDSLVGQIQGRSSSFAVADIASVAIRRTNVTGTLLLVGGLALVAVAAAAAGSSMGNFGVGY